MMKAYPRKWVSGTLLAIAGLAAAPLAFAADTTQAWRYNLGTKADDGRYPSFTNLVLASDGNYYGVAYQGGANGLGAIFRVSPDGSISRTIHTFAGGSEGCYPVGGLTVTTAGTLVGRTASCGSGSYGTIFRSTLSGNVTVLHSFTQATQGYSNSNCSGRAPIQRSDGSFVGVNCYGGPFGYGTAWSLAQNGTFKVLKYFGETFSDGTYPRDIALLNDESIVGVTDTGGIGGNGIVFKINAGNNAYSTLYNFTNQGNDGNRPQGVAVGPDNGIYGVTYYGGRFNQGTVFQLLNGKLKTLHHVYNSIVREGSNPYGKPTIDANGVIYGTTYNSGAVFRVTKAGNYATLYPFNTGDGTFPDGAISLGTDNSLFLATHYGGTSNYGTIMRLSVATIPGSTITVTPARVAPGGSVKITWKGTNVAANCTASGNAPSWSGSVAKQGNTTVSASTSYGRYYYWIGCESPAGGSTTSALAEVVVAPE